jgi:hypothetical protein
MAFGLQFAILRSMKSVVFIFTFLLFVVLSAVSKGAASDSPTATATPLPVLPFQKALRSIESIPTSACKEHHNIKLIELFGQLESVNQSTLDENQNTLLHLSVRKQCTQAVDWLLKNGADWKIRNRAYLNPFDLALQSGNSKILDIFLSHLSGAPVKEALSRVKIALKPVANQSKSEVSVRMGFSIANIENEQLINLNSALKGMYRFDSRTVAKGRTDLFFTKTENVITTFRYLVEGKVVRESLFQTNWNGALNLKAEGYPGLNTIDTAALVERTWKLFGETAKFYVSAGPGVRYIHRSQGADNVEGIVETRQGFKWTPNQDFLIFKGGQYTLSEDWTYTAGPSGDSSLFETSARHKVTERVSVGVTYKYWKNSIPEKDIDDNQILFDLMYETNP